VTAAIGDIASHLGCFIELKDSINAITFVALGTALPDTFASMLAAVQVANKMTTFGIFSFYNLVP
jgi:solute carrier family 8 (sodium/calcium exchanger)